MSATATDRAGSAPSRDDQRLGALELANAARAGKASAKRELRAGLLTLSEIAARRPEPLHDMPLFALLLEVPGLGQRRLEEINRRAITARVNLALTLAAASTRTLAWVVREVADGELDVASGDTPTPEESDWRRVAGALDSLIREHERSVRDESLPTERWAWADERLYEARARVIAEALNRLDAQR